MVLVVCLPTEVGTYPLPPLLSRTLAPTSLSKPFKSPLSPSPFLSSANPYLIRIDAAMDIHYLLEPTPDRLYTCLATVKHILATSKSGHILIFETGEREIEAVCDAIRIHFRSINVIPLYSILPDDEKRLAPAPSKIRKCVVATYMANSTVLPTNIGFVIDSGLHKQLVYNPRARMQMLQTVPISQEAAAHRSRWQGGGGGVCYRLYTEEEHDWLMPREAQPAVMIEDPAKAILGHICHGHTDILAYDWINRRTPESDDNTSDNGVYASDNCIDRPTPECTFDALERLNE
jgi:HrpA-like RNA helicase